MTHAQRLVRERHLRAKLFPGLGEPGWMMLIDLAANQGRNVSISSACLASFAPPTTALRYIGILERRKLVVREADTDDHRRFWLRLTPKAWEALDRFFGEAAPLQRAA